MYKIFNYIKQSGQDLCVFYSKNEPGNKKLFILPNKNKQEISHT